MIDFNAMLEQAREGAPRSVFTPHMNEIADPTGFDNPTQLRLLGNAISYSSENAAVLAGNDAAIEKLLSIDPLGLQVLFNGTVKNKDFSEKVLRVLAAQPRIDPSPAMKSLLSSIWELLNPHIPREFMVKLVVNGFLDILLLDPSLETESAIVQNFKLIYERCQRNSKLAEEEDELDTQGIRVIGNLTSHNEFGLDQIKDLEVTPFTWETVVLCANLTTAKENIDGVLAEWPNLVDQTVELIESEDPEDEEEEEEEDEMDEEVGTPPPFDLELWGGLFRNIARRPELAAQIAKHNPAKLFSRLVDSPITQTVAGDFVSAFSSNVYDRDLAEILTSKPYNGGSVLTLSSLVDGIVANAPVREELDWVLPRITTALVEGMLADPKEPVWIKGTRALAVLKAKFSFTVDTSKLSAHELVQSSEAVKSNLGAAQ